MGLRRTDMSREHALMSNTTVWNDPAAAREAENYENPIPSRELILSTLSQNARALSAVQLAALFRLDDEDRRHALQKRLGAMVRDGQLEMDRRGVYQPLSEDQCITGRVQGHPDGFGFLVTGKDQPDVLLTSRQMRLVFDGDVAQVRVAGYDHKGRPEGRIVKVLERNTRRLVGRYYEDGGLPYLRPDNPRINQEIGLVGDLKGARVGQFVEAEIVDPPGHRHLASARVVTVLGEHLAPGLEIDIAVRNFDIPHVWPPQVDAIAAHMSDVVDEADKEGRVDLRDLPLVTIDGEDARDFDDAVYAEKRPGGGFRLVVAIADVSHYVRPDSALDDEARNRGTSVYFPGSVIPMLPEVLSNGLCSLNPKVDRLCMVCDMTVSRAGRITGSRFYEAVMHSQARFTYDQVSALVEHPDTEAGQAVADAHPALVKPLQTLYSLFKVLRACREQRGALDFDGQETYIIFDADKKIEKIVPRTRNQAHMMIEECMLAANVCAAEFVQERKLPALYRNHEGPKDEKLLKLKGYLGILGVEFPVKPKLTPADFQQIQKSVADRPDAPIIETMLLRSMMQAVYSPDNLGHFGLAYTAYAHFTSPIRRYPDLMLHRVIRHHLHHPEAQPHISLEAMLQLGEHCSLTERRADEATRDVTAWLKCEYMQDHIGDVFKGVITAVTSFGFFVALDDIFVEGLVHIRNLEGDFYNFDPVMHTLTGSRSGTVYAMGDKVEVKVAGVNLDERKMDFELQGRLSSARKPRKAAEPAPAAVKGEAKPKAKGKPAEGAAADEGAAKPKKSRNRHRGKGKSKGKKDKV